MKRITQRELNQKRLGGAKVKPVKQVSTVESDLRSEIAQLQVQREQEFRVLADSIERTSTAVQQVSHELTEVRSIKNGTIVLEIHRRPDRMINDMDIMKTMADGTVRWLKATFGRDGRGDVDKVTIAPGT